MLAVLSVDCEMEGSGCILARVFQQNVCGYSGQIPQSSPMPKYNETVSAGLLTVITFVF